METDDLRCTEPQCGFRVPEDYFSSKPRFIEGICPRCGGNVVQASELDLVVPHSHVEVIPTT